MSSWVASCDESDKIEDLLNHRQHTKWENTIEIQMSRHLPLPERTDSQYLEALIYFSQLSQAMVVKTQAEHYR